MAKRTHHSNGNQNRKDHKHGIRKMKLPKLIDLRGINQKRMRNVLWCRHGQKLAEANRAQENSQ